MGANNDVIELAAYDLYHSILISSGGDPEALDYLFDNVEDFLFHQRFDIIGSFFRIVRKEGVFSFTKLVGILTITLPWKERLGKDRAEFANYVKDFVSEKRSEDYVQQLLKGLL
jgi:hypothetical protein